MNKQTLKFVAIAGLFLVPFVPFLVSSSLFFPFITTKAFTWRIIVEVVFAAWLLLAVLEPEYRPKRSPMFYAVFAFLGVMGLATIFGVDPLRSFWSNFERMEGYITLLHLGAFFLVIGSVFDARQWKRWWNASLVASGLMVLYCLFQLGGAIQINQGGVRVDGTFGNASYLAVYMLVHIFIAALSLWREWRNTGMRWVYMILMAGQLFILYHTATRGAILGLLGGAMVVAILNIRNKEDRAVRKGSLWVLGAVLALVAGFFLLKNTSFVENSPVLSRFSTITTEELKTGGRSFVWPMAVEGFKERPILGWGQDNFIYVFQEHYDPNMYSVEPWFDRAHNIFLDWMVAGGALGLLTYLSLYAAFIYLVWRRDTDISNVERSILTGLIAAYFFHNLFVFDHLVSYVLFFSLLAYVYGRSSGAPFTTRKVSDGVVNKAIMPAVALVLILVLYTVNFRPMSTSLSLINGLKAANTAGQESKAVDSYKKSISHTHLGREESFTQFTNFVKGALQSKLPAEEKNSLYVFAREVVISEAEKNSEYAKTQLMAGSFLSETGDEEGALVYLRRAKELIPGKQDVYFEIGSTLINSGDLEGALESFRTAYEMAPGHLDAQIIYLVGAIYANDMAVESEMKAIVPEEVFLSDKRILSAYYANKRFDDAINILERRKALDPEKASDYQKLIEQIEESRG